MRWEGVARSNLAELRVQLGQETAVTTIEETLAIAEELDDRLLAGRVRLTLGVWQQDHARFAEARKSYMMATDPLRTVGAKRHEATVVASLAALDHEQGNLEVARREQAQRRNCTLVCGPNSPSRPKSSLARWRTHQQWHHFLSRRRERLATT